MYRLARALDVPPSFLLPDLDHSVAARSPEQGSVAEVSRVEVELAELIRRRDPGPDEDRPTTP